MGMYLHLFETENDFNAAYNGTAYTEPWVSYTKQDENVDYNKDMRTIPLTIESLGSGNITWALGDKTVQYSKNGGEWTTMDSGTSIPVSNGDKVQFKGDNENYYVQLSPYGIQSTANFKVSGNIMSLLDSQDYSTLEQTPTYAFEDLFRNCDTLVDAENLILPATVLGGFCYTYMFYGCSNLVKGPKEIYATSIGGWACEYMFGNCESLTSAPALPTTNITERSCYKNMFDGCTSLTTAPELPAEILTTSAYQMMFQNCTNLNYVKCLATNPSGDGGQVYAPCSYWLYGVSPTGTFVKASGVTWPTGDSGIPSGWTVQEA